MLEFFTRYSINDIIIFIILFAIAVKAINDFIDWGKEKYDKKFNKDHLALNKQAKMDENYAVSQKQHEEVVAYCKKLDDKMDLIAKTMREKVDKLDARLAQLTESDKHDIKGWIVEKHHYLIKKGWVDDFTMDTLERRYSDYVAEEGNSYIAGLMGELRVLPHFPPEEE